MAAQYLRDRRASRTRGVRRPAGGCTAAALDLVSDLPEATANAEGSGEPEPGEARGPPPELAADAASSEAEGEFGEVSAEVEPAACPSAAAFRRDSRGCSRRISHTESTTGDFDPSACSGILLDFLERLQAAARASGEGVRGFQGSLRPARNVDDIMKTLMVLDFEGFKKGHHKQVRSIVLREQLYFGLMHDITHERKERGAKGGGWPSVGPEAWRARAVQIHRCKQEVLRLGTEVHNWLLVKQLLHRYVRHIPDVTFEKRRHLVNFWRSYHSRSWDAETHADAHAQRPSSGGAGLQPSRTSSNDEAAAGTILPRSSSLPSLQRQNTSSAALTRTGNFFSIGCTLPPIVVPGKSQYLRKCAGTMVLPTPLSFMTGESAALDAAGRDLTDRDLLAMAEMVQWSKAVEEVNLSDNSMLTDRSLAPFLQRLLDAPPPGGAFLWRLGLGGCARAGLGTVSLVVDLLSCTERLRCLDLSHVCVGNRFQLPLCQAIASLLQLEEINMADTGLGGSAQTAQCIDALLSSKTRRFDLGWNSFNAEVFTRLGVRMREVGALKSLCLSNCSSTTEMGDTPVTFFIEQLARDTSLTHLDISTNRIDFRAALVIEDSMDSHKCLKRLDLQGNPLGTLGMRSILRLLANGRSALTHLETEACYSGFDEPFEDAQVFYATNPGGRYRLSLGRPYHRALLRMLYKTTERFRLSPDQTFQNIVYSKGGGYSHASADAAGSWEVPLTGLLRVTFNIQPAIEAVVRGVADNDFSGFLARYFEVTRLRPNPRKIIPLFARWKELDGRKLEQRVYLQALSKDFNLTPAYLDHLCRSSPPLTDTAIWRLLPCLPRDEASRYMTMVLFPTAGHFLRTRRKMLNLLDFNVENPTGHYKLDLSNCSEYAVAEQLLLLDRWESIVDRRLDRFDTSSRGNRSRIRNEHYQNRSMHLQYASVAEWSLPEFDEFEFDYASSQRPPAGVQVLGDQTFTCLLVNLYGSRCDAQNKITVLRMISHNFYLTSMHMRQMLGFFENEAERAEAFVIFYMRIVDMYNAKLWRVRFNSALEVKKLQERLGHACFFPFIQPENARFELNLAFHDQRLCCSILRTLELREKVGHNIQDYAHILPDGTEADLESGVPRSWERLKDVPTSGTFKASYRCAPEHRSFSIRKQLAQTYGGFLCNVEESDVKWWTGLNEAPRDVVELMEFLISRYPNVDRAFKVIDGPGGNGVITLREFEEGLEEMGCQKFKSKTKEEEQERILTVFRYLDPGGEGSVSLAEWQVLNQLWNEFDLSIREFVQFLARTFGENLSDAWEVLDDDNSGELTRKEFLTAVTGLGYFGPARVVFALLDNTDDGRISLEEFEELEKYKATPT